MHTRQFISLSSLLVTCGVSIQACGDGADKKGNGDGDSAGESTDASSAAGDGDSTGMSTSTSSSTSSTSTGLDVTAGTDSESTTTGEGGGGPICQSASSDAEIPPVYLAFAFDVSGSMGKLDKPNWWHNPDVKWVPVVEATTAFFEDTASVGISASMALFPAEDDKCDSDTYTDPDVGMVELPSTEFARAFGDYEADLGTPLAGSDGWRGGTPTDAALTGVGSSLETLRTKSPNAKFAIVLVTDGLPQDCSGDLADAKSTAASFFSEGLPTYVIGIENPTVPPSAPPAGWDDDWGSCDPDPCEAPDNLSALNELAESGGTEQAFLIDTGDPTATQMAFRMAIEAIRESSLSCSLPIPDHPEGKETFEKDKIDVSVTIGGQVQRFAYDNECAELGSWHYDDEETPTAIELCDLTCADIKTKPDAQLNVDFLCEPRQDVIR